MGIQAEIRSNVIDKPYAPQIDLSGAITLSISSGNNISGNMIYCDGDFGIESVGGLDNIIQYNDIYTTTYTPWNDPASIRLFGSSQEHLISNDIVSDGWLEGILLQNSSANFIECNDVEDEQSNALAFRHNSPIHYIKGNTLDGSRDLVTSSELGKQIHLGNEFRDGTCYAWGLTDDEQDNSKFEVNENYPYHMPENPNPSTGWFFHDNVTPEFCNGGTGPGVIVVYHDVDRLCDYYNRIKSKGYNLYKIRLAQILKYLIAHDLPIPDCIKEDLEKICGVEKLMKVYTTLVKINSKSDSETQQSIINVQKAVEDDQKANDSDLALLKDSYQLKIVRDSISLDEQRSILDNIDCPDSLQHIWKQVLLSYIDELQGVELDQGDRNELESTAMLCAYEYGEGVHWARAILSRYDDINYSQYDDCRSETAIPRISIPNINLSSNHSMLYPSPSDGVLTVVLPQEWQHGELEIYDIRGQLLYNQHSPSNKSLEINLDLSNGTYMMKLIPNEGETEIHKFVILK